MLIFQHNPNSLDLMSMRSPVTLLLVALLSSGVVASSSAQKPAARLKTYFTALAEREGFSGGVLVTEKGRTVYQAVFGQANFVTHQANRPDLPFPIASVSKTLMAVAILQLEERGALSITDPVDRYLVEFPYHEITIRHLLSHTSGLPPYNAWFDSVRAVDSSRMITNADFLPALQARPRPLLYSPGDRGNYDNINYIVLALVLERVSGQSYEAYIKQQILDPAGMRHTSLVPLWQQVVSPAAGTLVEAHLFPHKYSEAPELALSFPYIRQYWLGYRLGGFSDYVSTMSDLQRYAAALMSGKLLRRTTLERITTPVRLTNGNLTPGRFGLGFELQADTSDGQILGHTGYSVGMNSSLLVNPSRRQSVVVFDNSTNRASVVGRNALAILNGHTVAEPRPSYALKLGRRLAESGVQDQGFDVVTDTVGYKVDEGEINELGYDFLGTINPFRLPVVQRLPEALIVFRLNTQLFPGSWNAFDSYGEALALAGQREDAIAMYRKSIDLNPQSEGGKKALAKLLQGES